MKWRILMSMIAAAALCPAQVALAGAQSGFVLDEAAGTLRPVIGYPGAAYLGESVALPFRVAKAQVQGVVALVVSPEGDAWLLRDIAPPSEPRFLASGVADAYLDATGRAGLLIGEAGARLVTSLDGEPSAHESFPVGLVAAVAFDENRCALIASSEPDAVRILSVCPNHASEPRLLRVLDAMDIAAMTYSARHGGLFIADRGASRVIRIGAPVDRGAVDVLAEDIASPVGIQPVGRDEILVAQSEPAQAAVIHVRGGVTSVIELPEAPAWLAWLAPDRILVCNRVQQTPLLVIDLTQNRESFLIPMGGSP